MIVACWFIIGIIFGKTSLSVSSSNEIFCLRGKYVDKLFWNEENAVWTQEWNRAGRSGLEIFNLFFDFLKKMKNED